MAFFVAIHQEAWPEHLDELLATIRANLDASPRLHPGRRSTRVFQQTERPTRLLSLSLWDDQPAFEQFRRSEVFTQTCGRCGPPPRIEPLEQLRFFERMAHRATVMACSTLTAPPERGGEIEAALLSERHREVENVSGLVCREVYREPEAPGHLLLVHTWESLADLSRFRAAEALQGEAALQRLGAMTERFTSTLAAEFSAFLAR